MASTCVRVAVRVRPPSGSETLLGAKDCVAVDSATSLSIDAMANSASVFLAHKQFTYDNVYGVASEQRDVYDGCVKSLVERFVNDGFNATVLAYGQTGSGKTWTMGTGLDSTSTTLPPHLQGIVPRAIHHIFELIEAKKSQTKHYESQLAVSFLELYNEELVDLLNPTTQRPSTASTGSSSGSSSRPGSANLPNIREDAQGNIVWSNVREEPVNVPADLLACLQRGSLCRSTGSTDMNAASSRSHAIFTVILKQKEQIVEDVGEEGRREKDPTKDELESTNETNPDDANTTAASTSTAPPTFRTITSKFHFVDLAGSERLKRTHAEGDRKKEGISINQGLLSLGNCISALGDESRRPGSHVPYRDSKLTRMLQDSLGGNSNTVMIACVSPSENSFGETMSTLTYANRARNIKNKVVVNSELQGGGAGAAAEKEIRALRALVADLREEIVGLQMQGGGGGGIGGGASLGEGKGRGVGTMLMNEQVSHAVAAHERDFQLHLQDERDLAAAVAEAKQETQIARFDADRYAFKCCRVMERAAGEGEELREVKAERDQLWVEVERWRSGRLSRVEGGVVSVGVEDSADVLLGEYVSTITELKQKLAETGDRLAWYNEVVSSFGSEESRRDRIVSAFGALKENAVEAAPSPRSVRVVKAEEWKGFDVGREGRVWKALKTDSEFGQTLAPIDETCETSPSGTSLPTTQKLFGLPKTSTDPFRPSSLTTATTDDHAHSDETCSSASDMDLDDDEEDDAHSDVEMDDAQSSTSTSATAAPFGTPLNTSNAIGGEDQSTNIYLLIHRLQNSISQHQTLLTQHSKREQEYQHFLEAYESKVGVLQVQLQSAAKERDEALKVVKTGGGGGKERPGTAAIKMRYEEQRRKLEREIGEYKRKMAEKQKENRERGVERGKKEGVTKQLMQTIESLKAEKFKALKELKKESLKIRDMKTLKEREIARLKKREKAATEVAKRLERTNQLQG
ncbi:Kinesin-like protein kif21b, partial [Podochytrium sp. JEL0797]